MPKKRQNRIGTVISASGITSLAPRVYLRNRDNASGSYPTIARTGDTRSGVYSSSFDDTSSVFIGASDNLILGSQILSSSQYISDFAASPSTNPSLVGPGTASFGVSDQRIAYRNPGQDLAPFSEHNLFACDPGNFIDPFYLTGSRVEDVGPGFSLPLKEKTKIVIDLSTSETSTLSVDGGASAGTFHHHMGYYNKDSKKFDPIGSGTFPQVDTAQESLDLLNIGFGVSTDLDGVTAADTVMRHKNSGAPISNFGFPIHPKYHATSSQLTSMGDYIASPFVVEKAVLTFSGTFQNTESDGSAMATFFILNQRTPFKIDQTYTSYEGDAGYPLFGSITSSIPSSVPIDEAGNLLYVDSGRDLVTYMQVVAFDSALASDLKESVLRELNVEDITTSGLLPPGEYVMSGTVKSPSVQNSQAVIKLTNAGSMVLTSFENGGRNALGLPTGRDLASSVYGENVSGSYQVENSKTSYIADLSSPKFSSVNNPYILSPDDNLVFGWQVSLPYSAGSSTSFESAPFDGKLTLYGSLVRDQKEFHQGSNQLLTSDSVHEDIRDNTTLTNTSDCLDQFLSEYTSQYSGSYIDNVFDEDLGIGLSRIGTKPNSIIAGHAGITGSLLRGVSLLDNSERFYDSVVPDIFSIFASDGATIPIDTGGTNKAILAFGETPFAAADSNSKNDKWFRSFPFESRYANVPRMLDSPTKTSPTSTDSAGSTPGHAGQLVAVVFTDFPTSVGGGNGYWCDSNLSVGNESAKQRAKIIYGIGQGISGSVLPTRTDHSTYAAPNSELVAPPVYRGFKYGLLNAVPQFTKAIFRYDRYGQFRDMLEQRLFAKFAMSGDESREVVSILFSRVFNTGDGNLVRRQFTPEDASGHLNIDPHSRVTKPFFDVSPENITKNTDVDSLQVANINSLAGGSDIDPKNLGLNDFTSFVKG